MATGPKNLSKLERVPVREAYKEADFNFKITIRRHFALTNHRKNDSNNNSKLHESVPL